MIRLSINKKSTVSLYRQIYRQIESGRRSGVLAPGEQLPSMNELAAEADISRETVKKAYNLLCRDGVILSRHGKGFFVAEMDKDHHLDILVLLDKQSIYKQVFLQAFQQALPPETHLTIQPYNQDPGLLEYYLDSHLDQYDYYIVSPHFALDKSVQDKATALLRRIPNRKLIMVDNWMRGVPGNYGVIYQDFRHDTANALGEVREDILRDGRLKVIVLPDSLYGSIILESVRDFAEKADVEVSVFHDVPESVEKGDVFLVLNSQLDSGLVRLSRQINASSLEVGKDVRIISYNEFPLNEIVLGGLTTFSTDFPAMGRKAAEMILSGHLEQIHNPFRITRRKSF